MSEPVETAAGPGSAPDAAKPFTKRFRKRYDSVRLSADEAKRQGEAARLAWETFKERDAMIAFLNTHDDALGGRPIDLAVQSSVGLATVQQALAARLV